MNIHNIRSPEQWEIISKVIDFEKKTVLDLGCGKGDILIRAFDAGAQTVGLDIDAKNLDHISKARPGITVLEDDIQFLSIRKHLYAHFDIIICFSVLPYLSEPERALKWINAHSDIALIECQYDGDGPGFLEGDDVMAAWLLEDGGFQKVHLIGRTLVEGRNKYRAIWMCEVNKEEQMGELS